MRPSLLAVLVKDTQVLGTDVRSPALAPLICKMSVKYLVYRALLGGSPSWCSCSHQLSWEETCCHCFRPRRGQTEHAPSKKLFNFLQFLFSLFEAEVKVSDQSNRPG